MRKLITIVAIFAAGYLFGDSALRVVRVAWSEVSGKVQPNWEALEDHLKSLEISEG